jgi:DnaK suppressor protein
VGVCGRSGVKNAPDGYGGTGPRKLPEAAMSAKKASARATKKKAGASGRATNSPAKAKAAKVAKKKTAKKKTAKKATKSKVAAKKPAKKSTKSKVATKKTAKKAIKSKVTKKKVVAKTTKKTKKKSRKRRRHPQLTPKVLEGLRRRLLEKRRELLGSVASSAGDRRDSKLDGTEDYIDYAVNSYDREFLLSLTEMDQKELFLVEDALRRIDRGEYGYCMASGDEIPLKRLDVQPWARYSVHNQDLVDQGLLPDTLYRYDAKGGQDPLEDDLDEVESDDDDDEEDGEESASGAAAEDSGK